MTNRRSTALHVVGVAFLLACGTYTAAAGGQDIPPSDQPLPFRSVQVLPALRTVVVTGWVNQAEGLIELLACGPGGKTHESLFVLTPKLMDLYAAMLLVGVKPDRITWHPGAEVSPASAVEIWVDWVEEGTHRSERAEKLVYNTETQSALPESPWVFSGSVFTNGQFMAQVDESVVATYWDVWAMFNLPLPCAANDDILLANEEAMPPVGTPVRVRFKAAPPTNRVRLTTSRETSP